MKSKLNASEILGPRVTDTLRNIASAPTSIPQLESRSISQLFGSDEVSEKLARSEGFGRNGQTLCSLGAVLKHFKVRTIHAQWRQLLLGKGPSTARWVIRLTIRTKRAAFEELFERLPGLTYPDTMESAKAAAIFRSY